MIRIPCALFALTILAAAGPIAAQKRSTSSSSHSSTHRVVVVNGKKIVDEKTVNGKRVPSKGAPLPIPGIDPEKMIRELRDRLRRAGGGKGLPIGDVKRSSHTRRVVVENGRTVVDEETRDGRPVKRGRAVPRKRATKKPSKVLRRVR